MKNLTFTLIILLLGTYAFSQTGAPQVISSAGNSSNQSELNLHWTVGEFFIDHFQDENNSLSQGFHQPLKTIVSFIQPEETHKYQVYPNPTTNKIFIELENSEGKFRIEMYDTRGIKLFNKVIKGSDIKEHIETIKYSTNVFLLKITDLKNADTEIFKIVKQK